MCEVVAVDGATEALQGAIGVGGDFKRAQVREEN